MAVDRDISMKDITLKELLEAGCHFGHQTTRWHPKAAGYIYGSREGIHIIDLVKTREGMIRAGEFLKDLAKNNKPVLFVAVKRQTKLVLVEIAKLVREKFPDDSNFYYLTERWPGGLLTNFDVIKRNNLDAIVKLQGDITADRFVTKKEKLLAQRRLDRYLRVYGGLVGLTKVPEAVWFADVKKNAGGIREAKRTGVKVISITDTNIDPTPVDFPIPGNDDAVGSIKIILDYLTEAWMEGLGERAKSSEESKGTNPVKV